MKPGIGEPYMNNLSGSKRFVHPAWHKTGLNEDEYRALQPWSGRSELLKGNPDSYTQLLLLSCRHSNKIWSMSICLVFTNSAGAARLGNREQFWPSWKKGRPPSGATVAVPAFCKHVARVDNPRFLTMPCAPRVIICTEKNAGENTWLVISP